MAENKRSIGKTMGKPPILTPTEAEFSDLRGYIQSIAATAEAHGLVKVCFNHLHVLYLHRPQLDLELC